MPFVCALTMVISMCAYAAAQQQPAAPPAEVAGIPVNYDEA